MDGIGVYQIRNIGNEDRYMGSTSVGFGERWRKHLARLRKGNHPCRHLQNAWNKYGEAAFVFEVVEYVDDPDQVLEREQAWIDYYWATGTLYNHSPTAGSTRGFRFSDEARARLSAALRETYNTEEGRETQRRRARQMFSSPEGRAAHQAGQRRRFASEEGRGHIVKMVANRLVRWMQRPKRPPRYTRTPSEAQQERFSTPEARADASLSRRARNPDGTPRQWNLRAPDGMLYLDIPNLKAFCEEHGLRYSSILGMYSGKLRQHQGWTRAEDEPLQPRAYVRSPSGEVWAVYNVPQFAQEHGINVKSLEHVIYGRQKQAQGWELVERL